jgi:hypothetical protein
VLCRHVLFLQNLLGRTLGRLLARQHPKPYCHQQASAKQPLSFMTHMRFSKTLFTKLLSLKYFTFLEYFFHQHAQTMNGFGFLPCFFSFVEFSKNHPGDKQQTRWGGGT